MTDPAARWRRIEQLCGAALERAGGERTAFLRDACGDDEALRHEVEQLLAQEPQADGFLRGSVATVAAAVMSSTAPSLTGHRFNALEVGALIGAGGMGEVYRARDTELKRDVALKVLPAAVAGDAERLARFRREAEVLASLNHPHIAAIYGLEKSAGVTALVMELVEGEDLSARIARGAIRFDDALPIAKQIAEALEAAHERGIIYRDLKPANIKVRADGVVKVLDFGLAKAIEQEWGSGIRDPEVLRISPTITSPAVMTGMGAILGTAGYMSPEQAKGREADKRSDIWAFGIVLFEMLTGRRAFDGEDIAERLGAVLRLEPNWDALRSDVPQPVRTLLHGCLSKDRRHRVSDISTVLFVLDNAFTLAQAKSSDGDLSDAETNAAAADAGRVLARSTRWRVALSSAVALLVGGGVATTLMWFGGRGAAPRLLRATVLAAGTSALVPQGADRDIAVTPDGSRIVYRGANQLLVRALDQLEATVLIAGGAPQGPFVSPDGQWVGFFDGTALKKVAITGGPPITIALAGVGSGGRGATWGRDGTIIFATATNATALQRVSEVGGAPVPLTTADRERGEVDHYWPEFLPGGKAILFTIRTRVPGDANAEIAVLDLRTGTSRVLIRGGSDAHYVGSGHLVYGYVGTLRAVAFDLERLAVTGTPVPVLTGVLTTGQGAADAAVAADGSLIYVPGVGRDAQRKVERVDREGQASPLPGLPMDEYRDVRVSPDGATLAVATNANVWTYDFARETANKVTVDPTSNTSPLWTPNGERIVFTSTRAGYPELFWRPADGSGGDERFFGAARDLVDLRATGWSADGSQLLVTEVPPNIQNMIAQLAIGQASASMLIKNGFNNDFATVSPDGGWIAYQSNTSGRSEIYVERYPQLGDRHPISNGGGRLPLWSPDRKELFFSTPDGRQMLAVRVEAGPGFVAGRPQVLFDYPMLPQSAGNRPYDIDPGGRFLVIRSSEAEPRPTPEQNLVMVQNWFEELKRLVPTK